MLSYQHPFEKTSHLLKENDETLGDVFRSIIHVINNESYRHISG